MAYRTVIAVLAAFVGLNGVALAQGPPVNDNYLESLRLNDAGKRLERQDTLRDVRDTSAASVQGDLFAPPNSGGPVEPVNCQGAFYGRTVWYDFYPDVTGLAQIEARGYDTVLGVVPFNRTSSQPNLGSFLCSNASPSTTEEFLVRVRKGDSYSIQVGGVNDVGGQLEFLFNFFADTDGDGVLDETPDRCPRLDGPENRSGCPPRLKGEVTLRASPTAGGIRLLGLSVSATKGAKVTVSCSRGCSKQVKTAANVGFPGLSGKQLPAGSKLVVRVTKRKAIGAYTSYKILAGNFKKTERCLNPGSRKPRRRCG